MAGRTGGVGAGLAGLWAAIHLAAAGREVVVAEAEALPGGRCGTATVGAYRFDTGPSVLTMPEVVRATIGAAGEELEDWLELDPLDPISRLTFHDGSRLDVVPGAERMAAEVERLAGPGEAARYLAFRAHLGRMAAAEWRAVIDRQLHRPGAPRAAPAPPAPPAPGPPGRVPTAPQPGRHPPQRLAAAPGPHLPGPLHRPVAVRRPRHLRRGRPHGHRRR